MPDFEYSELPVLQFTPTITSENVLFCYRDDDEDSLAVAEYYQLARNIPTDNFLALPCSATTTLTEAQYISQIETPLLAKLATLTDIYILILGFNVPYIYSDGTNTLSIPSRLHRLGHAKSLQFKNPSFNRTAAYQYFGTEDSTELFITAVFNGPDVDAVKALIDRAVAISKNATVAGQIYCNPYGLAEDDYQTLLEDFITLEAPNLGLTLTSTSPSTAAEYEYVDNYDPRLAVYSIFNFFANDSFYWGRGDSTYSTSLFLNQSEPRIFLYNADADSASNITTEVGTNNTGHWCNVAINAGYACTAGSVSAPGIENYLNPRAFFEALQHHSTIGEAFLFASPVVDWKLVFFGDPLTTVVFPNVLPKWQDETYTELHNNEGIRLSKKIIEDAIQYGMRTSDTVQEMVDLVVASADVEQTVEYLNPFVAWQKRRTPDYFYNLYTTMVADWCRYLTNTTGLTVSDWLTENSVTVSAGFKILVDKVSSVLDVSLIKPDGEWQFEFQYVHTPLTLENVNFEIAVSSDPAFATSTAINSTTPTGWFYEKEYLVFSVLPVTGFPSNLSKRRVRYVSTLDHYLTTGEIYYVRWRVIYASGSPGTWQNPVDPKLIVTEGI